MWTGSSSGGPYGSSYARIGTLVATGLFLATCGSGSGAGAADDADAVAQDVAISPCQGDCEDALDTAATDVGDDAADAEVAMPTCTTPCDDGDDCTEDSCDATGLCVHKYTVYEKKVPSCTDASPCSLDVCSPGIGCVHEFVLGCDDGNACTDEQCLSGTTDTCAHFPAYCVDGNPCTIDACDVASGCTFTPSVAPCDDGDICTTDDTCTQKKCLGKPLNCDDGDKCTIDACVIGFACTHKGVCDDGNSCTTDACDPTTLACSHAPIPDGGSCNSCSGAVCLAGACTGDTEPCFDSDPCTADACDAKTGKCVHAAQPCVKPSEDATCTDFGDCPCGDHSWPTLNNNYCGGSVKRKCSAGHRCYYEQDCLNSETKLNCGCVSNSQHYCPPNPSVPGAPVCPGYCVPPGGTGGAFTCSDWSSGTCPTIPTPGIPCVSDKYCPEASFCSAKDGCQPDTCNGGACMDGLAPHGGHCYACAANGSGLIGDPFDCNDGDLCTIETWSPATGCVHTAKKEGDQCGGPMDGMKCKQGLCVKS